MKKLGLFVILAFMSQALPAQTATPTPPPPPSSSVKVSVADSLFNEGNIKKAVEEYRKMYHTSSAGTNTAYDYACALSRDGQIDSAFRYLYISAGTDPGVRALSDPDLLALRADKRWVDFENKVMTTAGRKPENPIKDFEYAKVLFRLRCMDQDCFYETWLAVRKLGPDSPVVAALRRLQQIQNQQNLEELEALLLEKGWPKRSQVSSDAAGAAFLILQHSNATAQEKYLPLLEKCCRENEGDWQLYALMFDRMLMNKNLPQRYGTHYNLDNRSTNARILYRLEDETKVDEWRKEIGLEPLTDYLISSDIKKDTPDNSKK
jgi:hypothetical protein